MKHVDKFGLVIIVWLCLTGWLPISAKAGNSVEITSLKQLQVFLSSSTLKSDAVKDLNITANGILVDQTVSVESGTFRMHGGSLIRAEGFTETMLDIQEGANLTVENTIDGANIEAANKPLINIQKGGTFILSESGSLARASWISTDERTTIATPIPNPKEEFVILQSFVVSNNGTFIMDGGTISENTGGLTLLNNYSSGIFTLKKGSIKNNSCSTAINNVGTFNLYPNSFEISATGSIRLNTPMNILSSLNKPLSISVELKEGNIVAKGSGNYSLSQSDLSQLSISEIDKTDLILKLNNNQILLATSSDPGTSEITTPEELQKAIDKATGTADSPTIITIPKEGIRLTSPLIIEGKYIKLTGGTIWNNMTEATRMFELKSGKLILENITFDGYYSATSAPQFCTFVFLLDGEFIMKEGVILQNAKCHFGMDSMP